MIAVINFVVLAGGSLRYGFFAYNISPVDTSITTTERERISSAKVVVDSRQQTVNSRTKKHL
jgi:hypothetical protein